MISLDFWIHLSFVGPISVQYDKGWRSGRCYFSVGPPEGKAADEISQ